jgi:hypothetical protein
VTECQCFGRALLAAHQPVNLHDGVPVAPVNQCGASKPEPCGFPDLSSEAAMQPFGQLTNEVTPACQHRVDPARCLSTSVNTPGTLKAHDTRRISQDALRCLQIH